MYKLVVAIVCLVVLAVLVVFAPTPLPVGKAMKRVWSFMKKKVGAAKSYVSDKVSVPDMPKLGEMCYNDEYTTRQSMSG